MFTWPELLYYNITTMTVTTYCTCTCTVYMSVYIKINSVYKCRCHVHTVPCALVRMFHFQLLQSIQISQQDPAKKRKKKRSVTTVLDWLYMYSVHITCLNFLCGINFCVFSQSGRDLNSQNLSSPLRQLLHVHVYMSPLIVRYANIVTNTKVEDDCGSSK